jgi:hypothetical protein
MSRFPGVARLFRMCSSEGEVDSLRRRFVWDEPEPLLTGEEEREEEGESEWEEILEGEGGRWVM